MRFRVHYSIENEDKSHSVEVEARSRNKARVMARREVKKIHGIPGNKMIIFHIEDL